MQDRFEFRALAGLILAALVVWPTVGCDALAPSEAGSKAGGGVARSGVDDAGSETIRQADALTDAMESIGPGSAMRIYYQFIDDRGGVQFVERLDDVPEAWRSRVGYVEMDQPPPLTPAAARESWRLSASSSQQILAANPATPAVGRRMDDFQGDGNVVLYAATWCGYCTKARSHLDSAGIEYEVRDVDNAGVARELKEKTGRGGVPVLDFDGEILRGYSASRYDEAVRAIKH